MSKGKKKRRTVQAISRHSRLVWGPDSVTALIHFLDHRGGSTPPKGEISIAFLEDREMAALHKRYLGDPRPTDVLTFPGDGETDFAGEICLSVDQAAKVSAQRDTSFAHELALYLVHGWLHLCGFDDIQREDRRRMRAAENEILAHLAAAERIPRFTLRRRE